jgi:hypothetical protein
MGIQFSRGEEDLTTRETRAEFWAAQQVDREYNQPRMPKLDHSMQEYRYERLDLPTDENGYTQSFGADDVESWRQFFEKYGVVVIHNCLSEVECQRSEDEVWDHLFRHYKVLRDDPTTWETGKWPALHRLGILGMAPVLSPQLEANRKSEIIRGVYRALFRCRNVISAKERIGMMRPTKNVKYLDGSVQDKPDWESAGCWPHVDMCPWTWMTTSSGFEPTSVLVDYNQLKVQGMVALHDCGPDDGGLRVVPGFHNHLKGWANLNQHLYQNDGKTSRYFPQEDPIVQDLQNISLRAGSLCIFRSELPHDTRPCKSANGRLIQYMKMASGNDPTVRKLTPKSYRNLPQMGSNPL